MSTIREKVLSSGTRVVFGELPNIHRSVLVILLDGEYMILAHNPKRGWEFPGGHSEVGETIEETAIREAREETGATIRDLKVLGFYRLPDGHTTIITAASVDRLDPLSGDFETVRVE